MKVIWPMCGTAKRFKDEGYFDPKPMIRANNKPLIALAQEGYLPLCADHLYIMPQSLEENEIRSWLEPGIIFYVDFTTTGPVQTILEAGFNLMHDEVLIADCDSIISYSDLKAGIDDFRSKSADGGNWIRTTSNPECSFAKMSVDGWIIETKEKVPFTNKSTTGPYYFRSGEDFQRIATLGSRDRKITSISPLFNIMIEQGGRVRGFETKSFRHLGTPKDLKDYVNCCGSSI